MKLVSLSLGHIMFLHNLNGVIKFLHQNKSNGGRTYFFCRRKKFMFNSSLGSRWVFVTMSIIRKKIIRSSFSPFNHIRSVLSLVKNHICGIWNVPKYEMHECMLWTFSHTYKIVNIKFHWIALELNMMILLSGTPFRLIDKCWFLWIAHLIFWAENVGSKNLFCVNELLANMRCTMFNVHLSQKAWSISVGERSQRRPSKSCHGFTFLFSGKFLKVKKKRIEV